MAKLNKPATTTLPPKPAQPAPQPETDDDTEDGDICTPKRDREGTDDEPL